MTKLNLHPAPGYVLALPSPVNEAEEERASGLMVVHDRSNEVVAIARGVVIERGHVVDDTIGFLVSQMEDSFWRQVTNGAVVYYLPAQAVAIEDYVVFNKDAILALEES